MEKFNEGEVKVLKDLIFDLNEMALRQALFGILTVLNFKKNISTNQVKEILDDSRKYSQIKKEG